MANLQYKSIPFYDKGKSYGRPDRKDYYEFTNLYDGAPIIIGSEELSKCKVTISPHLIGTWKTSEHLFQAAKFTDPKIIEEIRQAPTTGFQNKGGAIWLTKNKHKEKWSETEWFKKNKLVMAWVVGQKFRQNLLLKKMLVDTGDAYLVENSGANDKFWGNGEEGNGVNSPLVKDKGENWLGRILMEVRTELITKPEKNDKTLETLNCKICGREYPKKDNHKDNVTINNFFLCSQACLAVLQHGSNNRKAYNQRPVIFQNENWTAENGWKISKQQNPANSENDNQQDSDSSNQPTNNNDSQSTPKNNNDNGQNQKKPNSSSDTNVPTSPSNKQQTPIPTIDTKEIIEAVTVDQARQNAQQQIQNLFTKSKIKPSNLSPSLWKNKSSWEVYLKELKTNQEILTFAQILAQKIKESQQAIQGRNNTNSPNKSKFASKILILSLVGGALLLIFAGLIIVKNKQKRRKKANKSQ